MECGWRRVLSACTRVCVCETAGRRLLERSQGTSATGTNTEEFILALDREPFIPGRTEQGDISVRRCCLVSLALHFSFPSPSLCSITLSCSSFSVQNMKEFSIFLFLTIPFFPFLPSSQNPSNCRFSQKLGAKPAFLVLPTLPPCCIYHTNTGCIITRALSLNTQIRKRHSGNKDEFQGQSGGRCFSPSVRGGIN